MSALNNLLDRGVALKRAGDLEGAKEIYLKALEIDPTNMMTYISLAKTAHLLKSQNLAVRCYLASTHLQLAPIERSIQQNNLPMHLKLQFDTFPPDILSQLPRKSAFVIYIDPNTPRHVAHTLIDLTPELLSKNPNLKSYSEVYHSHILGNGTHERTLQKWGLTPSDQIGFDEQIYIPYGREFLIQELQWDKISRDDVLNIYF